MKISTLRETLRAVVKIAEDLDCEFNPDDIEVLVDDCGCDPHNLHDILAATILYGCDGFPAVVELKICPKAKNHIDLG